MRLHVYAVYDKAVSAFLPPFYARSRGEALRGFTAACNDTKHQFALHPDDYVLYSLGEFDDESGFHSASEPQRVVSARESLIPADPFTEETRIKSGSNGRVTL